MSRSWHHIKAVPVWDVLFRRRNDSERSLWGAQTAPGQTIKTNTADRPALTQSHIHILEETQAAASRASSLMWSPDLSQEKKKMIGIKSSQEVGLCYGPWQNLEKNFHLYLNISKSEGFWLNIYNKGFNKWRCGVRWKLFFIWLICFFLKSRSINWINVVM